MAQVVRHLLVQGVDKTLALGGPGSVQLYLDFLQRVPSRSRIANRGRQILMNLPSTGVFQIPVKSGDGQFIYCTNGTDSFNLTCRMQFADYEPVTRDLFRKVAAHSLVTVDIGAYSGLYSLEATLANPRAQVWAFEPMSAPRALLQRNVDANGLGSRVRVSDVALSDHEGAVTFFLNAKEASSTRASILHWVEDQEGYTIEVQTMTMDSALGEVGLPIDLVKMDVEGVEDRVLAGGTRTLAIHKPVLFTEALSDEALAEQRAVVTPHGYGPPFAVVSAVESDARNYIWVHPHREQDILPALGSLVTRVP